MKMMELHQHQGRTGTRYWKVWIGDDPEVVHSEWGAINQGEYRKHGETHDRPGAKGKEGTKAWVSAEDNAQFHMERAIRKKREEGYSLVGGEVSNRQDEIDFRDRLPKNLCFSKPRNKVTAQFIERKQVQGELLFTRKINGMMVVVQVLEDQSIELYSRRMDVLTHHFPQLTDALHQLQIPAKTILLLEAFIGDGNTQAEFEAVGSIMRSKPERALALQEQQLVRFYLFRIPVWKGAYLERTQTVGQMAELIENTFTDKFLELDPPVLKALEVFEGTVDEARAVAADGNYEGWVAYVRSEVFGSQSFSFHGKPDRPSCCFKLKLEDEDDFVAYFDPSGEFGKHCNDGCQFENLVQVQRARESYKCPKCGARMVGDGTRGTGKHQGGIGTLSLYQRTTKGVPVYICEVGTGLTDEQKMTMANPVDYPMVVQVKYADRHYRSRGDKSNALIHPRIVAIREDKDTSECVNPDL